MEAKDWSELWQLNEQAKVALMMGNLDQMQMADAMAFHTLSLFILSLNERLSKLDGFNPPTNQPLVPPSNVVDGPSIYRGDKF